MSLVERLPPTAAMPLSDLYNKRNLHGGNEVKMLPFCVRVGERKLNIKIAPSVTSLVCYFYSDVCLYCSHFFSEGKLAQHLERNPLIVLK